MPQRRDPSLDRFLLPGERVVVDVRQHWGVIAAPVAAVLAGLFVAMWVDAHVRLDGGPIARALWWVWFAALGWLVFQILQWRHDRFIATDKRLLLNYGLFTTKVAMMPLSKVTDMSFQRSVPGRIFGWGRFILESAGQDQALRQIDWVPDPDHTYRVICAEIFGALDDDGDDGPPPAQPPPPPPPSPRPPRSPGHGGGGGYDGDDGDDGDDGSDPGDLGGLGGFRWSGRARRRAGAPRQSVANPLGASHHPVDPFAGSPVQERDSSSSYPRAIAIHRPSTAAPPPDGEVIYNSDDERRRRRSADTGPLPPARPARRRQPPTSTDNRGTGV